MKLAQAVEQLQTRRASVQRALNGTTGDIRTVGVYEVLRGWSWPENAIDRRMTWIHEPTSVPAASGTDHIQADRKDLLCHRPLVLIHLVETDW